MKLFSFLFLIIGLNYSFANCYEVRGNVISSEEKSLLIQSHEKIVRIDFDQRLPGGGMPRGVSLRIRAWGEPKSLKSKPFSVDIMRRYIASSQGSFKELKGLGETKCLIKINQ